MSPMPLPRLLLAASLVTLLGGCSILGSSEKTAVTLYSPAVQVKADPAWPQASWQLVL
ncbi:MAG: ABC transporter, partial [Lysobacteraceae bacterium]